MFDVNRRGCFYRILRHRLTWRETMDQFAAQVFFYLQVALEGVGWNFRETMTSDFGSLA